MVDIHSHLIWDIDDGSKSKDMTIDMLRQAVESGTEIIVSTPHYISGHYTTPINEVKNRVNRMKNIANEAGIPIEIYCGQEVYYSTNIIEDYKNGNIGTINDSRYMLIELNMKSFSVSEVLENLYELQLKGLVPVIAHPERYQTFTENPVLINKFTREGILFQLNSGSLEGYFGKKAKKTAEIFIENEIYNFIGSDAHRNEKRNPDMSIAIEILEKKNRKYCRMLKNAGREIINNNEVIFSGKLIKEKGFLGWFKK